MNSYMSARLVSGQGCIAENSAMLKKLGNTCLIVTGAGSAQSSGALGDVTAALEKENIRFEVFSGIGQNPLLSSCFKAGVLARETGADFIIGIGGGSPLDSAKAAAIFAANPEMVNMEIYSRSVPCKRLPVVLVGTTSGTGSEVTGVSVLTHDDTGVKKSISGEDCYAAISFLDPHYTYSMPYCVTVSTALDAFAHAVEGWFSPRLNSLAGVYAQKAIPIIFGGLKYLYENGVLPDAALRDELYYASVFAGLELNICGAAFPHTVGYVLTEDYSVPHGRACTAFMPELIERAEKYCPERLEALLAMCKTDRDALLEPINSLTAVEGVRMSAEQISGYCARWSDVKNFRNTPGGFSADDARKMLEKLYL
ncbi:MAG: iron-containing alcohol dehydrogenase [Clostridiales bacterium]|nr:iron-containing alcohol dehydrogenase [Clostridiales bacterium]